MPPPEEERFMTNVLDLCDLMHSLTTNCYDSGYKDINPAMILLAKTYLSSMDKIKLIEIFINNSHSYWSEIKDRNENFFIEHTNEVFGQLPVNAGSINVFKTFFTAKDKKGQYVVSTDDRDVIWDIFSSLVKIGIKYIHRVRECVLTVNQETGKQRPMYKHNRFPEIKVRDQAAKWDVKLEIPS